MTARNRRVVGIMKQPVELCELYYALLTHENPPLYCLYMAFEFMCGVITVSVAQLGYCPCSQIGYLSK